jgi:hypothetical protein
MVRRKVGGGETVDLPIGISDGPLFRDGGIVVRNPLVCVYRPRAAFVFLNLRIGETEADDVNGCVVYIMNYEPKYNKVSYAKCESDKVEVEEVVSVDKMKNKISLGFLAGCIEGTIRATHPCPN